MFNTSRLSSSPSEIAWLNGMLWCSWWFLGAAGLRAATTITFSPRVPHALVFLFCLSVAADWQLRGSRTPHTSVHPGCSLLHGYRLLHPAIGSQSAELPVHWLTKEGKRGIHWALRSCRLLPLARLYVLTFLGDSACVNILVDSFNGECLPAAARFFLPVCAD